MAISLLSPARCVLLIGDEALHVYDVSARGAKLLEAVPWQSPDFENIVSDLIRQGAKGKPVMILNDMTDQHFKGGQRLPKVGPFDKNAVMDRRIRVAFPNYPIRGALRMVHPKGAPPVEGGGKGVSPDLYLFAAVPMSEPIVKTLEAVRRSLSSVSGFALLPVEAADMVHALAKKLAGKKRKPSRWVIFIGQHAGGALRQVIIRDGQLAMTRMTPVSDASNDHGQWAMEVSQEFKATVSYLSRFGYSPEDGTDVIAVCAPEAGQVLETLIDIPCHYTALTAAEAARELGMSIGRQENTRHADPLHAAWIGRKARLTLPMKAPDLEKVNHPRQVAAVAILLLVLGAGFLGWQNMSEAQKMFQFHDDIDTQRGTLSRAQSDYQAEVDKMAALGFDVKLVQGSIRLYENLESGRLKTLAFLKKVDDGLGAELRLDAIGVEYKETAAVPDPYGYQDPAAQKKYDVEVAMRFSFPPTIDPEYGVNEVNNLRRRLADLLPGTKVEVLKNIVGREYGDSVSGVAGRDAETIATEDYTAEITIKGSLTQ